jgi:hypothetical protein
VPGIVKWGETIEQVPNSLPLPDKRRQWFRVRTVPGTLRLWIAGCSTLQADRLPQSPTRKLTKKRRR